MSARSPVRIEAVVFREDEEEGGWEEATVYPAGFVRVEGEASHGGYRPRFADGWYAVNDEAGLAELFAWAREAAQEALSPRPRAPEEEDRLGHWRSVRFELSAGPVEPDEAALARRHLRTGWTDLIEVPAPPGPSDTLKVPEDPQPVAPLEAPPELGPPRVPVELD